MPTTTNSQEGLAERLKTYARFGDSRIIDRYNYTTEPDTPERRTLQKIGALCWKNREALSSDDQIIRRSKRQEIISEALNTLKTPIKESQSYNGPQNIGSVITEHLVDIATIKSVQNPQAVTMSVNRDSVRTETLKAIGRNDILNAFQASDNVLSGVISELSPSPKSPEPMMV